MSSSLLPLLMIGAGLYAVCAAITLLALRRAPDGYEDEAGFHAESET